MKKQLIILIIVLTSINYTFAQNVNLEQVLTGKPFNIAGSVSANTVYYNSNQAGGRLPFTYMAQGALTVSSYQFAMPISYSYSNQGDNFNYQIPFKFNRLSLHPKYKWIQAHIGDVSMTFSPYTLSGHQFTGVGLELSPKGGFKLSTMYGRLLKATEDNGDPRTIPAFERIGYGAKLNYEKQKYKLGIIGFYAKDNINSIAAIPDEKKVTPKENLVISLEGDYKITPNLSLKATYATTAITKDLRATPVAKGENLAGLLLNNKTSTAYHKALKTGFDYTFKKSSIGISYERIDPDYETLGAHYFNNDFENITLNSKTSIFKGKVNLGFNIGYQRDDLNKTKETATSRTVGAVNVTINASKRLNITGQYSNFSTYTNLKPNQFALINNANTAYGNQRDALDYKQLTQNANVNINYIISKKKKLKQNVNINYSLADVANEQGGVVRLGDASTFHNISSSYTLAFPKKQLSITTAANATYNTIGTEDAFTWGPTLAISKKFFDKKLSTSFASAYNKSANQNTSNSVMNFRANARYTYKEKHNFNLSAVQLFKNSVQSIQSTTVTFSYSYAFNLVKTKENTKNKKDKPTKDKKDKTKDKVEKGILFTYKTHKFEGTSQEITDQILILSKTDEFAELQHITKVKEQLDNLFKEMQKTTKNKKKYKKAAIAYLDYLYKNKTFKNTYNKLVFKSLKKLYHEAITQTDRIKKDLYDQQVKVNTQREKGITSAKDIAALKHKQSLKKAHDYMLKALEKLQFKDVQQDTDVLLQFKNKYLNSIFDLLEAKTPEAEMLTKIELNLIKMYHEKALKENK